MRKTVSFNSPNHRVCCFYWSVCAHLMMVKRTKARLDVLNTDIGCGMDTRCALAVCGMRAGGLRIPLRRRCSPRQMRRRVSSARLRSYLSWGAARKTPSKNCGADVALVSNSINNVAIRGSGFSNLGTTQSQEVLRGAIRVENLGSRWNSGAAPATVMEPARVTSATGWRTPGRRCAPTNWSVPEPGNQPQQISSTAGGGLGILQGAASSAAA